MEKWILIRMQDSGRVNGISSLNGLFVCDENGKLMIFDSAEEAAEYQDMICESGGPIQIPLYPGVDTE